MAKRRVEPSRCNNCGRFTGDKGDSGTINMRNYMFWMCRKCWKTVPKNPNSRVMRFLNGGEFVNVLKSVAASLGGQKC